MHKEKGFTLLEVVLVIIIVGVLTSLALPRMFSMIEYSKSAEALSLFTTIRGAFERCYLINGSYDGCSPLEQLGVDGLSDLQTDSEFVYAFSYINGMGTDGYWIQAALKGQPKDNIYYILQNNETSLCGYGAFKPMGNDLPLCY